MPWRSSTNAWISCSTGRPLLRLGWGRTRFAMKAVTSRSPAASNAASSSCLRASESRGSSSVGPARVRLGRAARVRARFRSLGRAPAVDVRSDPARRRRPGIAPTHTENTGLPRPHAKTPTRSQPHEPPLHPQSGGTRPNFGHRTRRQPRRPVEIAPYRGLFPSPPLFDRMPTYRTQGKRSLNFLSARTIGYLETCALLQRGSSRSDRCFRFTVGHSQRRVATLRRVRIVGLRALG